MDQPVAVQRAVRVCLHRHRKFGFQEVGVVREVGWKFGRWHEVHIMEALL